MQDQWSMLGALAEAAKSTVRWAYRQRDASRKMWGDANKNLRKSLRRGLKKSQRWQKSRENARAARLKAAEEKSPIKWGYGRSAEVSVPDRLAERLLCIRHGWDASLFTGRTAIGDGGGSAAYRLLNAPRCLWPGARIDALRISGWGRFGNAIRQVINAHRMARTLGTASVEFAQPHPFLELPASGPATSTGNGSDRASRTVLEGGFYYLNTFRVPDPDPVDIAAIFRDHLRPMLVDALSRPDPRLKDGDLVLHFRGGDVFDPVPPHAEYGQPPVSYYLSAVDREKPARVWLVAEDDGNICIEPVEAGARQRGCDVVRQTGTLEDDMRVLLGAHRLAASRGSFAYMIAHLSTVLEKAYFFEPLTFFNEPKTLPILTALGTQVLSVDDVHGTFREKLLSRNWANSPEQRALMLSYPDHHLGFGGQSC